MIRDGLGGDRGSVAAEFAIAMTAVAVVVLLAVGMLGAAGRQILLQDAVADAARLASRGESGARVSALVQDAVPGATVEISDEGDLVCVTAARTVSGIPVSARGCALADGW
ncbi:MULTISPECIES: TadE family type IV pilus minor pilin [unclassified Microbacterium]|jgi:hypothetical protein|uniref:TadE family type IV pilus minor pilin n=1 Tax=unclassified Microbacterium TaxID=2609290 RepID=UPI000967E3B7|nr:MULTISPECIES: TadE family type IV pilus minor pilin [unclassified Microbacterium]MBD3753229.1 hypothetical protein [Micrococcales bacterium]OJV97328.1 MAG: hypothetical protein BGO47_10805 [Microbacterium sp. 67-17]